MSEAVQKYRVIHQDNSSTGRDLRTVPAESGTEVRTYFSYSLPNMIRGSNPGGGARISAPAQNGPEAHSASCIMGTGSFPGVKSGRGVTLTSHPLLVPWSRKSRVTTLLPLCAVWSVQSLSASTRVHLTLPNIIRLGMNGRCSTHVEGGNVDLHKT